MPSFELATSAHTPPPRAGRTLRGWLLRLAIYGLLGIVAGATLAVANGWRPWPIDKPAPAAKGALPGRMQARDPLADSARRAARSVVSIQTVGSANTRNLGAGFFVDESLIATNFHVVSTATEAQVRLADGRVFAVAGYAAVLPQRDVALLRLVAPPSDVPALVLADKPPPPATQVMAIGHPRGVEFSFLAGRISQRVKTSALNDEARRFVRRLTGATDEIMWLQHTATLAAGNSGGPLVDEYGRVLGINTWISRETGANYALPIELLVELLVELLAGDLSSTRSLQELARPEAQAAVIVARLNAGRVEALYAEAERIGWLPAGVEDYRPLQELALAMTAAHLPQSFQGDRSDQQRSGELQVAVTRIETKLREQARFGTPDQITIVNEQAALVLRQPHVGLFCFAQVERVVAGERGQRGMLMKLVGDEQPLFVSLDGQLLEPAPGEVYALFGANLRGEVVRYGDNPLQLITAPVIVSRTLILTSGAGDVVPR